MVNKDTYSDGSLSTDYGRTQYIINLSCLLWPL